MRLWCLLLVVALLGLVRPVEAAPAPADYPITNGHFYTQASGQPNSLKGFAITDDGGIAFWHEFQRLGGVAALGYPISRRYLCGGFVCQATQKAVLQWQPAAGAALFLNVLDDLSNAGFDAWLAVHRQIPPPFDTQPDRDLSWPEVVRRHLAILDRDPTIRQRFFADPDPIAHFGLPMSAAEYDTVSVVRAQRAVFQRWKVTVPWATAGMITIANGGDLAKEVGLLPQSAIVPEDPPAVIATTVDRLTTVRITVPPPEVARVAAMVSPAVPQIYIWDQPSTQAGPIGFGSGVVLSADGYILTANHVVAGAVEIRARWPDGRSLPARVILRDPEDDAAVLKVDAANLPSVPLGDSDTLRVGQRVVGIGYGEIYPLLPNVKAGEIRAIDDVVEGIGEVAGFPLIQTTVPLQFGDSGGPLLDLDGRLVGINSARALFRRRSPQTIGLAIPIDRLRTLLLMAEAPVTLP